MIKAQSLWACCWTTCFTTCFTTLSSVAALAQEGQFVKPYQPGPESFTRRVIATGLEGPWEVTLGPDDQLWVTERTAKRITRIDPANGALRVAVTIDEVNTSSGQDGLLGMALHPGLLRQRGRDFVYVAFSYDADPGAALDLRMKIRRYTYDVATQALISPVDLIDSLPASNDHNSGRLKFGPDRKLYYSIGDQGKNQGRNYCLENEAQRLPTQLEIDSGDYGAYQGKILRLNLDGSIPKSNPVIDGVVSHVYSYGHRNVQGLAFGPDGTLYGAEHGPKSDDEINVILPGKNYGWPHVVGYQDDQAYEYYHWWESSPAPCPTLTFTNYVVPLDVPSSPESSFSHPDLTAPIATFYTVPDTHDFLTGPGCDGTSSCSPTIAPGSVEVYSHWAIPGWAGSLLLPTLKEGALFRLALDAPDVPSAGDALIYFDTENRYRDMAISRDGRSIYIVTDPAGVTVGPDGAYITTLESPGSLLEFVYDGPIGEPPQCDRPECRHSERRQHRR